jgi:DNA-binding NarL/FixJ family response regulator
MMEVSRLAVRQFSIRQTGPPMKILVVDDHEIVRIGLKHLLSMHTVLEAADADSGLKVFKKQRPDVTILESRIPGDGLTCLARIKTDYPDSPVLIFGSHDNPTYMARAVALGAQGYIFKTATAKEILAAIMSVAEGNELWTRETMRRMTGALLNVNGADFHLTKREKDVLKQLAFGLSNKEIGLALGISFETVKEHVAHVLQKMGVRDRTQAAVWAVRKNLV